MDIHTLQVFVEVARAEIIQTWAAERRCRKRVSAAGAVVAGW